MTSDPKAEENQEQHSRQPIFLLPGVVTALIGLMVAVHLARSFIFNEDTDMAFILWFAFIPVRLLEPGAFAGGIWPLFWTPISHAFVHAGWEHLILNSAWLAIFGTPVARRYGLAPTLVIFGLSAVAGALAFAATTLPALQVLIGASGGVAGLTGAACRFIFQPVLTLRDPESGEVHVLGRRMATLADLGRDNRARAFIAIWVILNAAVPFLPILFGQSLAIAWQAHLGGFLVGLFMTPWFERRPSEVRP